MTSYYISRVSIAVGMGAIAWMAGSPWWAGLAIAVAVGGLFLWAPHSGRYTVQPAKGAAPLRCDERGRQIMLVAARNALLASSLALAGGMIYAALAEITTMPVSLLGLPLGIATASYIASDLWLRHS
ncbi:hypothetical protein F8S13_13645 [Chloroflexia bacterium SDU3-3]|nr:hypothetical protein F8S13_13645 [Chloroflexia bacterium SDU3-3]